MSPRTANARAQPPAPPTAATTVAIAALIEAGFAL